MDTFPFRKITVVGNAGSGKTTYSLQLQDALNLPLYHLDQYCWEPEWKKVPFDKFNALHKELCLKNEWIIEGSYIKLLQERIASAEVIIFLDIPRFTCLWRVLKRAIMYRGIVIPGNPEGCKQRIMGLEFLKFLKWVWAFNSRYRKAILDILKEASQEGKRVFVFTSSSSMDSFIRSINLYDRHKSKS